MSVDEWASLVATEVLNEVIRKHAIGDQILAAIADAIVNSVEKQWSKVEKVQ